MSNERILESFKSNPLMWGYYYFGHHFRGPSPGFHLKIVLEAMKHELMAVAAPRESAKAQSLDSKVLTKSGWTTIGKLSVGDRILGGDGKEVMVTYLHPVSQMDLYRVTFRGGASVLCNLDHLWKVKCPSNTKDKVLIKPLREIMKNYISPRHSNKFNSDYDECRYYIDLVNPIEFSEKEFILDPYTLGAWLGDGHSAGQRITTADEELIGYIPYRCSKNKAKYNWGIHGINEKLKQLNLINNKHIPKEYLFSSIKQREALLQGLIDTDGHIDKKKGCVDFSNKNKRLVDDFIHLVQSLGGRTTLRKISNLCNGKRFGSYRVFINLPEEITPCKLNRKLANYKRKGTDRLYIKDISLEKRDLGRCITISNPDGLYITDNFITTHNSTIVNFLLPIHSICFQRRRFIIIIQSTYEKAAGSLETIKIEFAENQQLREDFKVTLRRDAKGDTIFRHPDGFETQVLCAGREQIPDLRGRKFGAYRPDFIILDDVEDDEMVKNPDRRLELGRYFDDVVMLLGERNRVQLLIIGTILHDDSLMAKMVGKRDYPKFRKLLYKGLNTLPSGEKKSLWDYKWTVEELEYMAKHDPIKFAKEIQNDPSTGLLQDIHHEDFRMWRMENNQYILYDEENKVIGRGDIRMCKAAVAIDLAWEERRENDYSVIMPGLLTPQSDILVDTYVQEKGLKPDKIEEYLFSMDAKYRAMTGSNVPFGFEKAKLEKVIRHLMKLAMRRRNKALWFKDLDWSKDKIERIITRLQPRYKQHMIFHKKGMGDLERQLVRIRSSAHDDLGDALQGLVQLLEFPKKEKPKEEKDDNFDWWRKQAIGFHNPPKKRYIFGKNSKGWSMPHKIGYNK